MRDRVHWVLLVSSVISLLVAGCSSGSTPPPDDDASAVSTMRVGLTEWEVEHLPSPVAAGDVLLVVTNAGSVEHDLVVRGRLGEWETPLLAPGESARLAVRTQAGEQLHLDCDVPGHHSAGMHTTLSVADSTSGRDRG